MRDQSRDAIRYAANIARRGGGRLTVLFVNDPVLLAAAAAVYHRRGEFVRRTQVELERFIRRSIGPERRAPGEMTCVRRRAKPRRTL